MLFVSFSTGQYSHSKGVPLGVPVPQSQCILVMAGAKFRCRVQIASGNHMLFCKPVTGQVHPPSDFY